MAPPFLLRVNGKLITFMTVLSRVWGVNKKLTLTGNIFHQIRF
jgi:hypothetical protein